MDFFVTNGAWAIKSPRFDLVSGVLESKRYEQAERDASERIRSVRNVSFMEPYMVDVILARIFHEACYYEPRQCYLFGIKTTIQKSSDRPECILIRFRS